MNKIIISIFILLWVAVGAMAQTATVTGMVTDDMGPVIGAKEYGKVLELNNHSMDPDCNRQNAVENDTVMKPARLSPL